MSHKTKQFCLWSNCNNKCDFCYISNASRQNTHQKLKNIEFVRNYIKEHDDFETIGLIGGEFFQGQLKDCRKEFIDLICDIRDEPRFTQVWISASLLLENQDKALYECIDLLKNKDLYICTSYDSKGRFKNEEIWWKNFRSIYGKTKIHVETILMDAFVEEVLGSNDSKFIEINMKSLWTFKPPSLYFEDYQDFLKGPQTIEKYHSYKSNHLMKDLFISNRDRFLKAMFKLKSLGVNVREYIAGDSKKLKTNYMYFYLQENYVDHYYVYNKSPCSHFWNGYGYKNSLNCILCDMDTLGV